MTRWSSTQASTIRPAPLPKSVARGPRMPSLRLVMGSARRQSRSPAPLPLVFDEDETDLTWGQEEPKGKRRRAAAQSSEEGEDDDDDDDENDEEEGPIAPKAARAKGPARSRKPLVKAVIADDDEGEASMDVEDSDVPAPSSRKPLPQVVNGTGSKRDHRTIEGRTFFIEDDELRLEPDVAGDTKIDRNGVLQGGREFSTATFTSPHRSDPQRQYILAIDACRSVGFRDSVLFFKRNPLLYKVICQQPEKEDLIEEGRLHPNLRHRQVTMITARNFYKIFGARVIIGGFYVKDDYYESASAALGRTATQRAHVELYDPEIDTGTLAFAKRPEQRHTKTGYGGDVPRTRPPKQGVAPKTVLASIAPSMSLPRDQKYGGSGISPFRAYDPNSKARRPAAGLTAENWTLQYARAVTQANREIRNWRESHATSVGLNHSVEDQMLAAQADDVEREAEEAASSTIAPIDGEQQEQDDPARPHRRRARSPTRGVWDHHTAMPHIRAELQPARAQLQHASDIPHFEDATLAAARAGFSSVVCEIGLPTVETHIEPAFTVPDVWDFRDSGVQVHTVT